MVIWLELDVVKLPITFKTVEFSKFVIGIVSSIVSPGLAKPFPFTDIEEDSILKCDEADDVLIVRWNGL